MRFYRGSLPKNCVFPCIVLHYSSWDDYGFKTTHDITYYDQNMKEVELGHIKILDENSATTIIPNLFEKLDDNFYSLGQSVEFYEKLLDLEKATYEKILTNLNDVIYNEDLASMILTIDGFETSLLRNSEARKAFQEAKYLFRDSSEINLITFLNLNLKPS